LFVFSHIISTGVVASDDLNHSCNPTCALRQPQNALCYG
jgi:SET domain-containing protein